MPAQWLIACLFLLLVSQTSALNPQSACDFLDSIAQAYQPWGNAFIPANRTCNCSYPNQICWSVGSIAYVQCNGDPLDSRLSIVIYDLRSLASSVTAASWSIPPSIGTLSTLTLLMLRLPSMVSTIPPEMGQLTRLQKLYLDSNGGLTGPIPQELFAAGPSLYEIGLGLSGAVPTTLGRATNLNQLYLNNVNVSGDIVSIFNSMPNLAIAGIFNSSLSGNVSLMNTSISQLYADRTQLVGTMPVGSGWRIPPPPGCFQNNDTSHCWPALTLDNTAVCIPQSYVNAAEANNYVLGAPVCITGTLIINGSSTLPSLTVPIGGLTLQGATAGGVTVTGCVSLQGPLTLVYENEPNTTDINIITSTNCSVSGNFSSLTVVKNYTDKCDKSILGDVNYGTQTVGVLLQLPDCSKGSNARVIAGAVLGGILGFLLLAVIVILILIRCGVISSGKKTDDEVIVV